LCAFIVAREFLPNELKDGIYKPVTPAEEPDDANAPEPTAVSGAAEQAILNRTTDPKNAFVGVVAMLRRIAERLVDPRNSNCLATLGGASVVAEIDYLISNNRVAVANVADFVNGSWTYVNTGAQITTSSTGDHPSELLVN
jgi:hypothetical protein